MLHSRSCIVFLSLVVASVNSFQLPIVPCQSLTQSISTCSSSSTVLRATVEDEEAPIPFDENDVLLTPGQIKLLRKETSKRRARKTLEVYHIPEEETSGPFSAATLSHIANGIFRNDDNKTIELVEVRGLSKGEKKYSRRISELLAIEVGMEMDADVAVVELKGHAATLYCAAASEDSPNRIVLRNSYQPGAWKRRVKAPRDNRGQIILD